MCLVYAVFVLRHPSPEEQEESVCMYMAVCLSVDEFAEQN